MHKGEQGGIGRRNWNSEQQTRHAGTAGTKNKLALALLDYAQEEGIISADDRARKLTTVQRFVGNDVFREFLGLDQSDPDELARNRPKPEFNIILKKFIGDLLDGKDVNSRMSKDDIIAYTRPLNTIVGVSASRIEPEPLAKGGIQGAGVKGKQKPRKPRKTAHIAHEAEIERALSNYSNTKLISLYHSICSIDLEPHTPLISVGIWSFFEALTACAGRSENISLDSYLSKGKISQYGITGGHQTLRAAIERIRDFGNTTKHHAIGATFNGEQLNNDICTLKDVILKCIHEAATRKT